MATYVFSDVHGHLAALDRLLSRVSPGANDRLFMLGDMVDRGPDPAGIMLLVRDLPNCVTLMGNHEQLMLEALRDGADPVWGGDWLGNGGHTTQESLGRLGEWDVIDLLEWAGELPAHATCEAGGRRFLMAHAGIVPGRAPVPDAWSDASATAFLDVQRTVDLLWVRDGFWDVPTGLMDDEGRGAIVVAGHTPTLYVERMFGIPGSQGPDGLCRVLQCGATARTGWVPDKIAIDCAAAAGPGVGQLGMLCLDTIEATYEAIPYDE